MASASLAMIRKAWKALSRHGLAGLLFRVRVEVIDWWFDLRYGVNTRGVTPLEGLSILGGNKAGGYRYEPARVLPVRRLLRDLSHYLPQPNALVDFGSGKGRILLIAAECGFARATGVEFASELCAIARSNCKAFKTITNTAAEFTVVESDAVDYTLADSDSFFFFFNPFDDVVMTRVLDNIALSVKNCPRRIVLALYNTEPAESVARYPMFSHWRDVSYGGYRVRLFASRG
jgi:hypothetical protein